MTAPDSLPTDLDALQALLLAERARHAEELAAARGEADRAHGEIERLMVIIKELQRHRFGRRSERLDPDQLALALEDLEQMVAAAEAAAENDNRSVSQATPQRASGRSIAARCRCICRAKRSSSMSRTRPAPAAAVSSIASARMSPNGST